MSIYLIICIISSAHILLAFLCYRAGFDAALDHCGVIRGNDLEKLQKAMREAESER